MKKETRQHWDIPDIDALLDPAPLPLETGTCQLADGRRVVAVRNPLLNCTGAMLEWWFTFFETTEHLKWWHPHDHIHHGGWDEQWVKGENYLGATIQAVEALGSVPPVAAKIRFSSPEHFFSAEKVQAARANGGMSAAICGCIGFGEEIALDACGNPLDGRMIHLVRDTPWGCVLRSRFILGEAPGGQPLPEEIALGLLQHCQEEFTTLSLILPALYAAERAAALAPPDRG